MKSYPKLCTFLWNFSTSNPPPPRKRSFSSYFTHRSKGQLRASFDKFDLLLQIRGLEELTTLWNAKMSHSLSSPRPPTVTPEPEVVSLPFMHLRGPFASTTTSLKKSNAHRKRMRSLRLMTYEFFRNENIYQKKSKRQFPPLWAKEAEVTACRRAAPSCNARGLRHSSFGSPLPTHWPSTWLYSLKDALVLHFYKSWHLYE